MFLWSFTNFGIFVTSTVYVYYTSPTSPSTLSAEKLSSSASSLSLSLSPSSSAEDDSSEGDDESPPSSSSDSWDSDSDSAASEAESLPLSSSEKAASSSESDSSYTLAKTRLQNMLAKKNRFFCISHPDSLGPDGCVPPAGGVLRRGPPPYRPGLHLRRVWWQGEDGEEEQEQGGGKEKMMLAGTKIVKHCWLFATFARNQFYLPWCGAGKK